MTGVLAQWNQAPDSEATDQILPCNGSRAWALSLVRLRPFTHNEDLLAAADTVWFSLNREAWQQAFDSHPRIGEHHAKAASAVSLSWSAGEQSGVTEADAVKATLAAANREYEGRFGLIFIVCATGKSAAEMLAILKHRLGNDPETELREVAEQQRRITQLRLRKWLGLPAARCEDV